MNQILEDIGGLVDVEDHEGGSGADGNDQLDIHQERVETAVKKTFVTSCPGMDGGSVGIGTTRWTKQGSASLAEKILSSLSPDVSKARNDAVICLYLQQIQGHKETIQTQEMQIDSLCQEFKQELACLQDKLQRAVRRANKLEMHLKVLNMMGTHRSHSSQCCHKQSLSPITGSESNGSTASSQCSHSPSQSILQSKCHHGLLAIPKLSEKGKGKIIYQEKGDDESAA